MKLPLSSLSVTLQRVFNQEKNNKQQLPHNIYHNSPVTWWNFSGGLLNSNGFRTACHAYKRKNTERENRIKHETLISCNKANRADVTHWVTQHNETGCGMRKLTLNKSVPEPSHWLMNGMDYSTVRQHHLDPPPMASGFACDCYQRKRYFICATATRLIKLSPHT